MFKQSLTIAGFSLMLAGAAYAAQPAPQTAPGAEEATSPETAPGAQSAPQDVLDAPRPGSHAANPDAADSRQQNGDADERNDNARQNWPQQDDRASPQ